MLGTTTGTRLDTPAGTPDHMPLTISFVLASVRRFVLFLD